METKFSDLPWHDAELLHITIDRHNPGKNDQIVLDIRWSNAKRSKLIFSNCFKLEAKMNFGIIAPESILDASLTVDNSQKLTEIKDKWAQIGVDLGKLKCFEIRTNSTDSLLRIYAFNCSIIWLPRSHAPEST